MEHLKNQLKQFKKLIHKAHLSHLKLNKISLFLNFKKRKFYNLKNLNQRK